MTKSIALGLLALAVSTSLTMAQDKPMGGWSAKPGSGLKYDGGDAFGIGLANQLQVHWILANNEFAEDTNNFTVRRARTTLAGHVFNKNILFKLQLDGVDAGAAGDGNLKEGHVTWNFMNSESGTIGLRFGQGKVLFGLEGTGSSSGLFFVERSSASRAFSDGYSRGAWLTGKYAESKFRWVLGAMNSEASSGLGAAVGARGEEAANSDNELSYVLAANFDPMGDYFDGKQTTESARQGDFRTDDKKLMGTIGAGIALGNGTVGGADLESTTFNINTAWSVNNIQIMGEYFMRTDDLQGANDEEEASGFGLSGTYVLPKSGDSVIQWGLGLRVNMNENDAGTNGTVNYLTGMQGIGAVPGDCTEVTAVVNAFYHGHACKTQFEYTFQDIAADAGGDATNHIFRLGFQLLF